ncbi:hypothetical protein RI367_007017 [Sorochytrium milnesiophthora]
MARKLALGALLAVVLLLSSSGLVVDGAVPIKRVPASLPANQRHIGVAPKRYIVELDATPVLVKGSSTSPQTIAAQQSQFRAAAQADNVHFEEHRSFSDLFNGLSVKVDSDADVAKLAALPGVKAVYPVLTYRKPPHVSLMPHGHNAIVPKLRFAHNMTNINKVHADLGLKGKGIKIGIIDTGIDYMHPAFFEPGKQCTSWKGDGCRVKYGQDLVGDAYTGDINSPPPTPGPSPMDCAGHGTHVSGIAGGFDGNITGVAPEATFGAYRVFGCGEGSTSTDLMVAAMEQAYKDGMDVINLSIGGGSTFAEYPDAAVAARLGELGLMVQAAMGNDGDKGLFMGESPGLAAHGFGVGSFDNIKLMGPVFNFGGFKNDFDGSPIDYDGTGSLFPVGQALPIIAATKDVTVPDDGCAPFANGTFANAVALIRRGTCSFVIKAQNAQAAGATGVLIYNNVDGIFSPSAAGVSIPLGLIEAAPGEAAVAAFFAGEKPTFTLLPGQQPVNNPTGGLPSDFSSWGPGPDLAMKPDIATPGGMIFSSVPRSMGYYDVYSGTSMATPYFTGCVALWIEQNKHIKRADRKYDVIRELAQNAGKPAVQMPGFVYSVGKQGPGLIDALQFLRPTVSVSPSRIPLGDLKGSSKRPNVKLTLTNNGPEQTFTLSHLLAPSANGLNITIGDPTVSSSPETARVTFNPPTVQIKKGGRADVTATINLENANLRDEDLWILTGYIVVSGDKAANTTAAHVPYLAVKGDYSQYPIVADPQGVGAPLLTDATMATSTDPNATFPVWTQPNDTATFTLKGTSFPLLRLDTVMPTRLMTVVAFDSKTNKKLGYVDYETFFGPGSNFIPQGVATNSSGLLATVYGWDTSVFQDSKNTSNTVQLGDGAYYWKVSVVKERAGPPPADVDKELVEVWKSPTIVINAGLPNPTQPTPTPTPTAAPPPPKYHHHPTPTPTQAPPPPPPKYHRPAPPAPPTATKPHALPVNGLAPVANNKPSLAVVSNNA